MNKSLTVKQPWAYLICEGIKDIENRTWRTKYRGRVYIHASKTQYKNPWDVLNRNQNEFLMQNKEVITGESLKYSAIIGHVDIIDCVINHPSIWAEKSEIGQDENTNEFIKPVYNWVLANPVLFDEPILNVKGALSFWDCSKIIENYNEEQRFKDMHFLGSESTGRYPTSDDFTPTK